MVRTLNVDRISNIPEHLMVNILSRLPFQEAIRTSILSKKWRHNWETIPLVFDNNFANALGERYKRKNEILLIVYQVLLLHQCPIVKFNLSISELESCPEIDHILHYLSKNDIQELTLSIRRGGSHKLPSSFFSCNELGRMELSGCSFKLPISFNGFKKLTLANFYNVYFDNEALQNLILKCPSLGQLQVLNCEHVDHLDLYAPKLKTLIVVMPSMSICFKNTPLLTRVCIVAWKGVKPGVKDVVEALGCLPSLHLLCAGNDFLRFLAAGKIVERLPNCFNRLRILKIVVFSLDKLIRISSLLRELEINVERDSVEGERFNEVVEFLQAEKHSKIQQNQLEKVGIKHFVGTRAEMELVQLLLYTSPSLKRMRIHPVKSSINNDGHVRILKDIAGYPRASTQAQILYLN